MRCWRRLTIVLLVLLSGCTPKPEPSFVLLDQPVEACVRSMGGRFVALGNNTYFDMQSRTTISPQVPVDPQDYNVVWMMDEVMLYYPWSASGAPLDQDKAFEINRGGFLLDVATGVITDVTTLPQATQDQLFDAGMKAGRRDFGNFFREAPNDQYWFNRGRIHHYDPSVAGLGPVAIASNITTISECTRPWEPDSSGIIFLERPRPEKGSSSPLRPRILRFLPVR